MKRTLLLGYSFFLLLLTFFSYLFVDPNLIYMKNLFTNVAFQYRFFTSIIYVLFIVLFFLFYVVVLYLLKRGKITIREFWIIVFLTIALLIFSYPAMLSYDIFNYLTSAKVLFFYHENPYVILPIEFINEPYLLFTHAANKIALYGPVWILFTGIPHYFGLNNFILTLFNFKFFVAFFYIGTTALLFKISKNVIQTAFFSLNPLVIMETLISGHNDMSTVFLVLFSFWTIQKNKMKLGIVFFILSIFIKYVTIFLLPVYGYIILKKVRKDRINWDKVYMMSLVCMIIPFLLSPLREEIYPWYAIWFLPFVSLLLTKAKGVIFASVTFALLLRYIPYMLLATHFGVTPFIKTTLTFGIPSAMIILYVFLRKKAPRFI